MAEAISFKFAGLFRSGYQSSEQGKGQAFSRVKPFHSAYRRVDGAVITSCSASLVSGHIK